MTHRIRTSLAVASGALALTTSITSQIQQLLASSTKSSEAK